MASANAPRQKRTVQERGIVIVSVGGSAHPSMLPVERLRNAAMPFQWGSQCACGVLDMNDAAMAGNECRCRCVQEQGAERKDTALGHNTLCFSFTCPKLIDLRAGKAPKPMCPVENADGTVVGRRRIEVQTHGEHLG